MKGGLENGPIERGMSWSEEDFARLLAGFAEKRGVSGRKRGEGRSGYF